MAKLILSMDGLVLKEYTVTKERTTIGRKPHNDIQIDNLAVSGEHAVIVTILSDSFLEDLGSTNGTQVNGQPIKKHFLQNNDLIELGKYKLKYMNDPATAAPRTQDFERTMVLRPKGTVPATTQPMRAADVELGTARSGATVEEAEPPVSSLAAHVATSSMVPHAMGSSMPVAATSGPALSQPSTPPNETRSGPMTAVGPVPSPAGVANPTVPLHHASAAGGAFGQALGVIQVLTGSNAGRELELTKALTTLGKPGVQVAVITKRPQGYYLTHVEGAVFPIVNGRTLDAQAHSLRDHDVIELAGVKMEFYIK